MFSEDPRPEVQEGVFIDSQPGSARERGTRRNETCITHSITELGIEIDYNIMVAMHMRGAGGSAFLRSFEFYAVLRDTGLLSVVQETEHA